MRFVNAVFHSPAFYRNGNKITCTWTQQGHLWVQGGRITTQKPTSGPEISLEGAHIFPGFHEAHGHLHRYADALAELSLNTCGSWQELLSLLAQQVSDQAWIIGKGWNHSNWADKEAIHHRDLDRLFPDRPVYLERVDLHAAIVNGAALRLAGISQETNVAGGLVAQDAKGPTGLLIDGAMELVKRMMPAPTEAEIERRLLHAQTILLRHGITAFTDALLTNIEYERLCRLAEEGKWHIRIFGYLPADEQHLSQWLHKQPSQEGKIRICGFKAFADGALGSRGAWLLAPYEDAATTGLDLLSSSGFDDLVKRLAATPWQLMVHAIGDAANEYVLETFFQHRHLIQPEARWRLEHAQMLTPKSWELLRQLSVIPSIQPTHATSDKEWVTDRIGKDRLQYAYPLGSLVRAGFPVPLGTDVPVESPSPLDTLFSAVTRRSRQLPKFSPILLSEQMPPEEAMMGMTLWPAYAVKAEKYLGSLSDTIFADFFAIDHNLLTVSEEGMCEAQVLMTVIDGKIIFS